MLNANICCLIALMQIHPSLVHCLLLSGVWMGGREIVRSHSLVSSVGLATLMPAQTVLSPPPTCHSRVWLPPDTSHLRAALLKF